LSDLKVLYQEMADLTRPKCAGEGKGGCRVPLSCCSPEYCEFAMEYAKKEYGVELVKTDHPKLPLMGPTGCTAAPYLRPMCSLHLCAINGIGLTGDKKFDADYYKLREKIEQEEWKHGRLV
jgi:hypothetical protein